MTFDFAQEAFRTTPTNKTAGDYLETAIDYSSDDMIGDDTFFNAVNEVAYWLQFGEQIEAITYERRANDQA
jgi:hypothetical protein